MKHIITGVMPFLLTSSVAFAQQTKIVTNEQQVWLGYLNQTRVNKNWGVWFDGHLRTKEDYFTNFSQSIARVGVMYYLNDATKLTAGYAYINHFPADAHKEVSQPEHRPWQQVQWHTRYGNKRMMQWIRLEERYRRKVLNDSTLAKGYSFNSRIRYNLWYEVPFSKKGPVANTFSFIANDELHINIGKRIVYHTFDQNRLFIGLKYAVNAHDNVQFGYMNLYQQLASGNSYRSLHTLRIFYFHNPDLRKKKA